MPESVKDRCTKAHEYIFLLTKNARYFYDNEAIKEKFADKRMGNPNGGGRYAKDCPYPNKRGQSGLAKGVWNANGAHSGRNKCSVWTVTTKPYPGGHYACVDTETEALTRSGWKKESELRDGDEIAMYDKDTNTWRWGSATFHRYNFDGEMVSIEKRETSQLLTLEHRCIIRRRMGHQGNKGWNIDVKPAKELMPGYELLLSANYEEQKSKDFIGTSMASLLGWFVTDGEIRKNKSVRIYQSISKNKEKCEKIRKLLNLCGATYTETIRKRMWRGRQANMLIFNITGEIANSLINIAPNKKLTPDIVVNLSRKESTALFEAIVDGDGHRRSNGRIQIIQKDKHHIDTFQMLAIKLGYKTVLSRRKDNSCYQLYITNKRWLTLRGANGSHEPVPRRRYNGTIWCPSVETGFWVARRNGKTFITGNTFPPDLIEPCILAGTSEKGVCPKCGAPWRRVVERNRLKRTELPKSDPRYRPNDYIGAYADINGKADAGYTETSTLGWQPTCDCGIKETVPAIVFDPFIGSGTTAMVARKHGRKAIGLDLNYEYLNINARERLIYGDHVPVGNGVNQLTLQMKSCIIEKTDDAHEKLKRE